MTRKQVMTTAEPSDDEDAGNDKSGDEAPSDDEEAGNDKSGTQR